MNITLISCAGESDDFFGSAMDIRKASAFDATGTPPREENEFKISIDGSHQVLKKNSYLIAILKSAFERSLDNDLLWHAPRLTNSSYSLLDVGMGTFCFLDIYLDNEEGFNYKNGISYRIRYRWHSRASLIRYLLGSENAEDFPHRCEYQLKIYSRAWKDSFNNCLETRFEYRNDSFPFKTDKSAPPPPWPFEEYIKPAISGEFNNHKVITTVEYARFLKEKLNSSKEIFLKPSLIIVTTRRRIHLGMKNEFGAIAAQNGFGSMTNADQVILATLDSSEVYQPGLLEVYLNSRRALKHRSLTKRLRRRMKNQIVATAQFTEAEFEFERNIESALMLEYERTTEPARKSYLDQVKQSFISDVQLVSEIIGTALKEVGLKVKPGSNSKYRQAWESIYKR